jgi:hypothetical protein
LEFDKNYLDEEKVNLIFKVVFILISDTYHYKRLGKIEKFQPWKHA